MRWIKGIEQGDVRRDTKMGSLIVLPLQRPDNRFNLRIIVATVKTSRKYPNLRTRSRCSFVIGWAGERTVQYEGEARELAGPELERCQEVYFRVWPNGPARLTWPGIVYFIVKPKWI